MNDQTTLKDGDTTTGAFSAGIQANDPGGAKDNNKARLRPIGREIGD